MGGRRCEPLRTTATVKPDRRNTGGLAHLPGTVHHPGTT